MQPELYTGSMEEAALTLPWALGFYLPISEALPVQNICATTPQCVFLRDIRRRFLQWEACRGSIQRPKEQCPRLGAPGH